VSLPRTRQPERCLNDRPCGERSGFFQEHGIRFPRPAAETKRETAGNQERVRLKANTPNNHAAAAGFVAPR
jgi:hypothetical protein